MLDLLIFNDADLYTHFCTGPEYTLELALSPTLCS